MSEVKQKITKARCTLCEYPCTLQSGNPNNLQNRCPVDGAMVDWIENENMRKKIEMKGYATSYSQKGGETEDGKQDYIFGRNMHLSGEIEIGKKKYYISEHGNITLPHIVTIENENRLSFKDAVSIKLCTILSLTPLRNQAGEPRRECGFDLFEAEIEIEEMKKEE